MTWSRSRRCFYRVVTPWTKLRGGGGGQGDHDFKIPVHPGSNDLKQDKLRPQNRRKQFLKLEEEAGPNFNFGMDKNETRHSSQTFFPDSYPQNWVLQNRPLTSRRLVSRKVRNFGLCRNLKSYMRSIDESKPDDWPKGRLTPHDTQHIMFIYLAGRLHGIEINRPLN